MEVMKLLLELSEQVQAKQGEKANLREKVDDVDQAVAQILGEIQKAAAACSHRRCVTSMLAFVAAHVVAAHGKDQEGRRHLHA